MELRQRKVGKSDAGDSVDTGDDKLNEESESKPEEPPLKIRSFWLTRIVFLRSLGFIYFVAFLVAFDQNKELIGDDGVLPLKLHLEELKNHKPQFWQRILAIPTVLWWWEPWDSVDSILDGLALMGMAISLLILITGAANMIAMAALWILYHSIVNVGQRWYSFGWESQLLETGFLGIWIVPLFSWKQFPTNVPPPLLAVIGYRWLIMRIMIGAGLIKVRGDKCWLDFTCMDVFYETQPNPSPVSYFAHFAPWWWHRFEVFGNHVVELIFPFFTILPWRIFWKINGFWQIVFQLMLISTGNLSFLNWLTILPSLWYFDDETYSMFFSRSTNSLVKMLNIKDREGKIKSRTIRKGMYWTVGLLLSYLSWPIVQNLLSRNQVMNTSFEPFRLVNTYGAFGSVTKTRDEVVLQGTNSSNPHNTDQWFEYEFKCKPGDVGHRPCLISPYHYRLDWLMWFAGFQRYEYNAWLVHLAGMLLENHPKAESLIAHNPFSGADPPKFIRAAHYRYNFPKPGSAAAEKGQWWKRRYLKPYFEPMSRESLTYIYNNFGWKWRN